MWKNTVELDRPQTTMKYGTCALCAGYSECAILIIVILLFHGNTYCFSMATVVRRTRLDVKFYLHYLCLVLIIIGRKIHRYPVCTGAGIAQSV
jgi:hypothetical protein